MEKPMVSFVLISLAILMCTFPVRAISIGFSERGIIVEQWRHQFEWTPPNRMTFGCSAAIENLPDVNRMGTDPDTDLEIVTGSDELEGPGPGYWHAFDSQGNLEWIVGTQSDQSRSSPVIIDLNGDGKPEIAGGTTSGHTVEVMDRFGNWFWTFPTPPGPGGNEWLSSPAVADIVTESPDVAGPEVVILHRTTGMVFCFDGDNSDHHNNGITVTGWAGTEGIDWDVLWATYIGGDGSGNEISSPAIGDVDHDGKLEVMIGSADGNVYVLRSSDGAIEHVFTTGSSEFPASVALADLDGDGYIDIVVGSTDGNIYCLKWDGIIGTTRWKFSTGGAIYSSAAIGDLDADGRLEIVVGSNDGNVYCLSVHGNEIWSYHTDGPVFSSPALIDRADIGLYEKDWPMFRHDPMRTGYYGPAPSTGLDVYVGSDDHYLYLLKGDGGHLVDRFLTYGCIRSSPSVADIDGDEEPEIVFYDWGYDSGAGGDTFWCIEDNLLVPPPPSPPVGGVWIPINGLNLLDPRITLGLTMIIAITFVGIRRIKKRQD